MALAYLFSVLGYICMVAAVCGTLREASQQIELDYPLTQYPHTQYPHTQYPHTQYPALWKPSTAEASMTKYSPQG